MKGRKLAFLISPRGWLLIMCAVLIFGLLALNILGALAPINKWSINRLARQLRAKLSSGDRWKEALLARIPPEMERTRAYLAPTDYTLLRRQAAVELGKRGPSAKKAVRALLGAISSEDDLSVVHEEFTALGKIGPDARKAIPELLTWLSKPDPLLTNRYPAYRYMGGLGVWKQGAGWALARIGPERSDVSAALLRALALCGGERERPFLSPKEFIDPSDTRNLPWNYGQGWPSARRTLIRAIGEMRPQTQETLAALLHELSDGDYSAQATAADVLGEIRPTSSEIIGALRDVLRRTVAEHPPDWQDLMTLTPPFLDTAHGLLFKTNPAPEVRMVFGEAPTALSERLATVFAPGGGFPGWGLRLRVIQSLGRIGKPASEVAPLLRHECVSETNILRFDAAIALLRLDGESPEVVATFEQGLQATNEEARTLALERLVELGSESPKTALLLAGALGDRDFHNRLKALEALSGLGSNAISVLPAIRPLTNDRNSLVRKAATKAVENVQTKPPLGRGL